MADETAVETAPAATTTSEPSGTPAPNGNGGATWETTRDWRDSLGDELRLDKSLADFKDVGALAKSYVSLRKTIGDREVVRVPKPDAKPEDIAAYRKAIGVPESPDKYGVEFPKMPEGMPTWHEPTVQSALQTMHKAGLTPAQVSEVIGWYAKDQMGKWDSAHAQATRQSSESMAKAVETLEKEWGPRGGIAWERNVGLAKATLAHYFHNDPELLAFFEEKGNNPNVVRGFYRMGKDMKEDSAVFAEDAVGVPDKASLDAEIAMQRKALERMTLGSKAREDAKAQFDRLLERRYRNGR
jgi:hypothetical protein